METILLFNKSLLTNTLKIEQITKIKKEKSLSNGTFFDDTDYNVKFKELQKKYDLSHKFSWRAIKNEELKLAQRRVKTTLFPLSGPINKNILSSNEDGIYKILELDKYGFKNTNLSYEKKIDIMVIGDSFVYSDTLPAANDVAGILRKDYSLNALNFGLVGTSFLSHNAIFTEYAIKLKPKIVFLTYYEGNDLPELSYEKNVQFLNQYLNGNNQNLIENTLLINELISEYELLKLENYIPASPNTLIAKVDYNILDFLKLQNLRIFLKLSYFTQPKFEYKLFNKVLKNINNMSKKHNIEVKFIYLPSWKRFNDYYGNEYVQMSQKKKIINYAKKYFETLDLTELFISDPNKYFHYGLYGHYNKLGLSILAQEISKNR